MRISIYTQDQSQQKIRKREREKMNEKIAHFNGTVVHQHHLGKMETNEAWLR